MESESILLVEGIDDLHAVRNLLFKHDIPIHWEDDGTDPQTCRFEIQQAGGKEKLPAAIKNRLNLDSLTTLGVVRDADDDVAAAWESVYNDLVQFDDDQVFSRLHDLDHQDGWVGETINSIGDPVRIGVWVMPDNVSTGALEDFAETLIPNEDALWPYSGATIDDLPDRRFRDVDEGKARLHTWLAWQDPPRLPIGRSITKGRFLHDTPLATRFADWATRLFPA